MVSPILRKAKKRKWHLVFEKEQETQQNQIITTAFQLFITVFAALKNLPPGLPLGSSPLLGLLFLTCHDYLASGFV